MNWSLRLSIIWLCAVSILVIFAPVFTPYNPVHPIADPLLSPKAHPPSGTDHLGRDEWSRLLYGGRTTLGASFAATTITVVLGLVLGATAAIFGGPSDRVIVGISNAALAIPGLLLAMILIAGMGPGIMAIVLAVGIGGIPGFTRMSRSVFRELRETGYVLAAQAVGTSQIRIIRSHIFPNSLRKLAPVATINFAWAILGITTLTFLGLAGDPSIPEWGVMLNDGRGYLFEAPWLVLLPGLLISTTVIVVHAVGKRIGKS
ncbi:MAG: ABC transporter permease [Anaerolineales bacterium]